MIKLGNINPINWDALKRVAIICCDGVGGSCLGQQCAHFARQDKSKEVSIFYAADDAKFQVIKYLFPDTIRIDESYQQNNNFERDESFRLRFEKEQGKFEEIYYIVPDLLYQNRFAFDFIKYRTHPQIIRQTRLLGHLREPSKEIFVGLVSSTPGYSYFDAANLAKQLGERLPDYTIYIPFITEWSGHKIELPDFKDLPANVILDINPDFIDSVKRLKKAEYGVFLDNGLSHLAYNLGIPRTVLDPQFQKPTFQARWREDLSESVPLNIYAENLAKLVELNLRKPYTTLTDRIVCFQDDSCNWEQVFTVKVQ